MPDRTESEEREALEREWAQKPCAHEVRQGGGDEVIGYCPECVVEVLVENATLRQRAEEAEQELRGEAPVDTHHPTGRCRCYGEGRCLWCKRTEAEHERDAAQDALRRWSKWYQRWREFLPGVVEVDSFIDQHAKECDERARLVLTPAPEVEKEVGDE